MKLEFVKTAFMERLFTKLLVSDFIFSETMSTRVVIDILIWMPTNLGTF